MNKILLVVAHPDDEYAFAGAIYRFAREQGGTVDQVVITNGEAGFRYSQLASVFYGVDLSNREVARELLPEIRRRETIRAGQVLGIRHHYFLEQVDSGFTLDAAGALAVWDGEFVAGFVAELIRSEGYSDLFVLLPSKDTHGHHKAAAILTIRALGSLEAGTKPNLIGAEPGARGAEGCGAFVFDRDARVNAAGAQISYRVVVDWAVAEHKTQGWFQAEGCRHEVERFWILAKGAQESYLHNAVASAA